MKKLIHFEAALVVMAILLIAIACEKEDVRQDQLTDTAAEVYENPAELESMPEYKGGNKEFFRFIQQHIKYPQAARESGIEGKVFVSFVIDKNGKVTEVQSEKFKGEDGEEIVVVGYQEEKKPEIENTNIDLLIKESVRVIQASGDWKPGMKDGSPVNVKMTLPITFKLG